MGWICGGAGEWKLSEAFCPWCCVKGDAPVRVLEAEVFGGYCGPDFICGACGQEWSADGPVRRMREEERDANIARVAAA